MAPYNRINLFFGLLALSLAICILNFSDAAERDKTQPIKCFRCNSYWAPDCADWFYNQTFPYEKCPPFNGKNATMCRKIVQQTYYGGKWNKRYIRDCAYEGEVGFDEGRWCTERIGTFRVKMKYCHCDNRDGCNISSKFSISFLYVLISLLIIGLTNSTYTDIPIRFWTMSYFYQRHSKLKSS